MNRPEPIELENNLGPDAVTGEINRVPWMAYDVDEMDIYIAEKDAEIAELKQKLMPCLNGDCILTCEVVEKYGKENAELKARIQLDDDEMAGFLQLEEECGGGDLRNYIAELKQKLEDSKATAYAESVDAGMRERRLRRALWRARAQRANDKARIFYFAETCGVKLNIDGYSNRDKGHTRMCTARWWRLTWLKVERKCLKKVEELK